MVKLPRSYPATAVQRRRNISRRRAGEDEFLRRFRFVVAEPYFAHQLADPALRTAHVAGRVPPWAIVGDELTEQALHLVRLLGIDGSGPPSPSIRAVP